MRTLFHAVMLLLMLETSRAQANFGSLDGGWSAVPTDSRKIRPTGLETIRIVNERLTIDLRACDGSDVMFEPRSNYLKQPVGKVEAIYHLLNNGSDRKVHLIFAAGSLIESNAIEITLNDRVVPVWTSANDFHWDVPYQTPGIDGYEKLHFSRADKVTNFVVHLKIPAGPTTLRVQFRTLIGNDRRAFPTCCWQFIYLLAPARDWGGFDKLDLKVLVPPAWDAACNLDLTKDGDIFSGTFDHIPDDAVTLTIRMPMQPIVERINRNLLLAWIGVAVLAVLVCLATRFVGIRIRRYVGIIPVAIMSGVGWGAATWLGVWLLMIYPIVSSGIPMMQRGAPGETEIVLAMFTVLGAFVGLLFGPLLTLDLSPRKHRGDRESKQSALAPGI